MQKGYFDNNIEKIEELNNTTSIIKKEKDMYIRVDDANGKGVPGDYKYIEYFKEYIAAERYAKVMTGKTKADFQIYENRETNQFYVFPKTKTCGNKHKECSRYIRTVSQGTRLYLFKVHHHNHRTGKIYSTTVGIMKAKDIEEAKEKIWKEYGNNCASFHDDEIEEVNEHEDTKAFGILV